MDSLFSHRLNTNYVPTDGEVGRIQMDLVSRAQELARLDERIRELSVQRDRIQDYVDAHKALISFPRRLPADILREIFMACLPTSRNAVMSAQEAPLLLCRICSAWRTIALSTPRLWASIHVPFGFVLAKEPRVPAVAQWLQRSGACPISLSVNCTENLSWDDREAGISTRKAALIECLAGFSARWRHTEFQNMSHQMANELSDPEMKSPMLESFRYSGRVSTSGQLNFLQVPTLRTVILSLRGRGPSNNLNEFVLGMPLPWDRLSHLILDCNTSGVSPSGVIALLRRCTRLISINITVDRSDAGADLVGPPLSVPSLESFILSRRFLPPRSLIRLIEQVPMPRLRRFHVGLTGCDEVQDSFCLVPLGKTSPLIDNLTIHLSSLTPQSLPETLQSFPSVTKLVVFDDGICDWDDDLVQPCNGAQLINLLVDIAVCPVLQELVVHHCSGLEKSTLDSFIQRRIGMEFAHRLRRLEISFQRSWSPEVEIMSSTDIRSYLLQGLTISLLYEPPSSLSNPTAPDNPWTGLPLENDMFLPLFRQIEGLEALE